MDDGYQKRKAEKEAAKVKPSGPIIKIVCRWPTSGEVGDAVIDMVFYFIIYSIGYWAGKLGWFE